MSEELMEMLAESLNANEFVKYNLEKFYKELKVGDNLKTAQSIRNMLNELPSYLAIRIKEKFESGIILDEELTLPAKLEKLDEYKAKVTIHQGKYHQVKRMFEYFGYTVVDLDRIQLAFLTLGDLEVGEYRELTDEEVNKLKSLDTK